ncbi:RidA family protein [Nitriliruptor alkaliphilus]|uniref:RidA family protein n=1 Tax=Nitriliruptor alkaliphilus TaxID=427918 RepID=UPI0006973C76|nr:RidA family protein [Nitriliruptor alkaliphilus]
MTHQQINPEGLLPPVGFSHAVVSPPGRTVWLGGQTGHHGDGSLDEGLVAQFRQALRNLVTVLEHAGAHIEDVVSMQLFVTDVAAYRAAPKELGAAYREVLGKHFPAIALFGIAELLDPDAVIEIVATAVIARGADA